MRRRLLTAVALASLAASCGGGGSSGVATTTSARPDGSVAPTSVAGTSTSSSVEPTTSAPAPSTTVPAASTTFGGTADRAARTAAGPDPALLRRLWSSPELDGLVYAAPLVAGGRIYVATEGDSVYALDAANGQPLWRTNLGTPVPRSALPCGNIDPTGITGTGVIDPASGTLYVVAFAQPGRHVLAALDLDTGAIRFERPVDPPGLDPRVEQQRAALTVANGRVYVAYGGLFGDCGPYKGALVGLALDGSGEPVSWVVPTEREGGIWAPSGPSVDPGGNLYVAIGNAESRDPKVFDYGNAVVRLTPELALADYWAPRDFAQLSAADRDLGSIGPVPAGGRLFVAGKSGVGYVLDPAKLGGIGGEVSNATVCRGGAFGGAAVAPDGLIVVGCSGGPSGVRIGSDGSLATAWHGPDGRTGAPVIAGATAWLVSNGGHLFGLDVASGEARADIDLGVRVPGFPTPAVTAQAVYAPAGSRVDAFVSP